MNKKLAKKLKEAGFPEITRIAKELNLHRYHSMDKEAVSFPFLQELIAETPQMEGLTRCGKGWYATEDLDLVYQSQIAPSDEEIYKTPEEAVANLWLSLNRKL